MIDTNAGLRIVNEGKFTFVRNQNKLVNMNLEHGARPFPVLDFFNVPENLARTAANPGRKAANAAADAIGALVAFPEWPEGCPDDLTDYNDLAAWNTANARL